MILGLVVWRNLRIENHIIIVAVEPPLEEKPEAAHIVRLKLGLVKRNERNVFVCEEEKEYIGTNIFMQESMTVGGIHLL